MRARSRRVVALAGVRRRGKHADAAKAAAAKAKAHAKGEDVPGRAAHRPARPVGRVAEALRGHGEDRQHAGRPPEVRRRPGRRRVRGGRRGGITRLAAIFNSQTPDRVGPVRSVRKTDQSLVWPIGGIFAYSGGAPYAIASINTAPVVRLDETRAGPLMFRDHSRNAP